MRKALWLIGGLLVLLALAMITGFQPLYWLVYMVVGGAALGYLWAWLQSRWLEIQVQERTPHPQVGQTVHLKVTVREMLGLPRAGLRARLVGDLATMDEDDFSLSPRGSSTWTVSGLCRRRGLNTCGSLAIVSGDPSGLVRLECRVGEPQSIIVYPATFELSRAVVEGQTTGGELGEAGQVKGHSPAALMVRRYASGDSLSRIHWPTTARLDQLMTKEFEGSGINEIWIFVDLQEAIQTGTGEESTEEYGITIAASLAKRLVNDGHSVGLITHGDTFYRFAPSRDPNHLWAVLKALALVRARGRTPLASLMAQESGGLGPGTVAVVIGPWGGQNLSGVFQFLARRGILVVPIFLDAASFERAPEPRWTGDGRVEARELGSIVRRGDELSVSLGNVLDRIATY